MIIVKSTLAPGQVALWERHPDQPGGEIFIADDEMHQVVETAAVRAALGRGALVEVEPAMVVKEIQPPAQPALRESSRAAHKRGHK